MKTKTNLFKSITKFSEASLIIYSSKRYNYVGKVIRRSGYMVFLKEIHISVSDNDRLGFLISPFTENK